MRKTILLAVCFLFLQVAVAQKFGHWSWTANGLPAYNYTGPLPVVAFDKDGKDANQPEDPHFLLGNYRLTLIAHASGIYQLFTAERAWARMNAAERPNYGWNDASLQFYADKKPQTIDLVGVESMANDAAHTKKTFGVGFARYEYSLPQDLICTRTISVKPSPDINTGNPAFVATVQIQNGGSTAQRFVYKERTVSNYVLNGTQYTVRNERPLTYRSTIRRSENKRLAVADVSFTPNTLLHLPSKAERYAYDVAPPSVYMYAKEEKGFATTVTNNGDTLTASALGSLQPGQIVTLQFVIGITENLAFSAVEKSIRDLFFGSDLRNASEGLFAANWKKRLPSFDRETDELLRREMLWNAHFIEASAKYSKYYGETFVPQGSVYSYYFGDNISNRDHLQAALPACYTNPALAKSILRYVLKHTETDGEIKRGNNGYGYTAPSLYKESDPQLYFFYVLSEYLRITKDYAFLNEPVSRYPAEDGKKETVLNFLKKHFVYLRDEIGTGPNGLVKILNSDWSDSFFHLYSPNVYNWSAESHLNSAMVLAVFPNLIEGLKAAKSEPAKELIAALVGYHNRIESAFMKDLGNRKFAARAYLRGDLKFGLENVCLEPQGYLLQIPSLPMERKKEVYATVKKAVLEPEKIGARTREKIMWGGKGDGEDGGIWFSLEYPLLLGVGTFDREEAMRLLKKFSFQNFAEHYPEYWVGQWTAADEVNSTLHREGLYAFWVPSQNRKEAFQGWCSHPHTWPLYCYYKLKENRK